MSWKKVFLKVAAFVPAIVLVGGFVGVRAGLIQVTSKPEPAPEPTATTAPEKPAVAGEVPTYMPGSKSIVFTTQIPAGASPPAVPNSTPLVPTQGSSEKPPAVMYGSKSAPIVVPLELIPGTKPTSPPIAPPNTPKP
ncbi:unnamed protein product [Gemmata massiliana]|uniref:Uncharacterized protein n=1 Tax=Gemmata massiliana TaxID=1210884 RepID=A0A6P2DM81_9BACT|nr:hypothetical protein [Gemmata massiliana]VTS03220.1 unnamed protein product [Gemmata massiliana]